jgi:hypothetical protein
MWRIFANCVKYHSHPSNKDAVPSFVSIALHLREFFNALWQEYMMPSDPVIVSTPTSGKQARTSVLETYWREAFEKRERDRQKRLSVTGVTGMTADCLERTVNALAEFSAEKDGRVDELDEDPVFSFFFGDATEEVRVVERNLGLLRNRLRQLLKDDQPYGLEELSNDLKKCYTVGVFEDRPSFRIKIGNRINRFLGKIIVPIHEASCRGVGQSSIWGCMAAAVWARENGKKPYWPALVLGILAPEDQKEEWHAALTSRNEQRLPEKLRSDLNNGKRKAEQAIRRQSLGQGKKTKVCCVGSEQSPRASLFAANFEIVNCVGGQEVNPVTEGKLNQTALALVGGMEANTWIDMLHAPALYSAHLPSLSYQWFKV